MFSCSDFLDLFVNVMTSLQQNKCTNFISKMQRLDSYYKRNYKDYFEFVEGSLKGKEGQQLTESEKGILDWLKSNK